MYKRQAEYNVADNTVRWQVSALFGELPGGETLVPAAADELEKMNWGIKRDLTCGGGLLVLEFAAAVSYTHLQRNLWIKTREMRKMWWALPWPPG